METSSINDRSETNTVNNGYLKSTIKKNYLPPTNTTTNNNNTTNIRPRVIQWDPHMGTDQSTISVVLEQAVNDASGQIMPMKLVFGKLVVETNQQEQRAPTASPITATNNNNNLVWITLVAQVPKFSDTQVEMIHNQANQLVPLSICVYDLDNTDTAIDHWNFGIFTYKKGAQESKDDINKESRKRGLMSGDLPQLQQPQKKLHLDNTVTSSSLEDDQLFNQLLAPFEDSPIKNNNSDNTPILDNQTTSQQPIIAPQPIRQAYSSSTATTPTDRAYYGFNDYGHNPHSMLVNIQPNPASGSSYAYNTSTSLSYHRMGTYPSNSANTAATSSGDMNFSSMTSAAPLYSNYPGLPQQAMMSTNPLPQTHMMMNTAEPKSNTTTPMTSSEHLQHPFAGVLSKANLKIIGDLMEMTCAWSQDEWSNGRRLVEFWRRQEDGKISQQDETISEVECGFKPIDQEVYQQRRVRENLAAQKEGTKKKPNPLIVSCIYWQERNDYFITSVDCIYLLEGLIGVQFTVEEKNRIRRNLEGFRPLTVSKCKPDCADFFKLIMSFPHPKPRNIEKDVKVFSWKTLPNALQKIIRKYTPSYSSTAVVNLNK